MKVRISLHYNKSFIWYKDDEGVNTKGYLFDENDKYYANKHIIEYFQNVKNIEDFSTRLLRANGHFAVAIIAKEKLFVGVDKLRSIPLFYAVYADQFLLSDDIHWISDQIEDNSIYDISAAEFMLTGYVTGNETLVKNIKQLQAGECLISSGDGIKTFRYFVYRHGSYFEHDDSQLIELLHQKHVSAIERLIKSLDGRTAVIPLSGGHDSRLIAWTLKELGHEKVIFFSYGVPGNEDSEISRKVANYFGYLWHFIPYSNRSWAEWSKTEEWEAYFTYADGLASVPHIQDWPAVWELKNKKLIPDDCIFVPGHSYDFIAGSHIPVEIIENKDFRRKDIAELIIHKHYSLWNWSVISPAQRQTLKQKICFQIDEGTTFSPEDVADIFECWDWQERQAKFICNSLRVYEFWGYEWRIPLWDLELMNYWSKVALDKRYQRKLFYDYVNVKQEQLNKLLGNESNMKTNDKIAYLRIALKEIKLLPLSRNVLSLLIQKDKKRHWKKEYNDHLMGWYGILDESFFRNNYTGFEIINSYLALLYLKNIMPTYRND